MIISLLLYGGVGLAVIGSYAVAFVFGYHATANRIQAMEDIEEGSRENAMSDNPMRPDWQLTAEEIDEIDDWEEFKEDADDDSVF